MKSLALTDCLDAQLLGNPEVRRGKMFGHPAYYVNDKMFACIYGEVIGLKLPEDMAADLIARGRAEPFQPYGKRKMSEWIELSRDQAVLPEYQTTIRAALRFVQSRNPR